jgi:hypothetical protein
VTFFSENYYPIGIDGFVGAGATIIGVIVTTCVLLKRFLSVKK